MKIIIVTSIMLPMPPVKGGAVQNLIKLQLDENEISEKNEIHVFSFYNKDAECVAAKYKHTTFHYVPNNESIEKIHHKGIKGVSGVAFRYRENYYIKYIIKEIQNNILLDNFDILLLENCPQFAPMFREAVGISKKIIVHLHNDYINKDRNNVQKIVDATDKFICVSDYISNLVKKYCPSNKVATVHNGVDIKPASENNLQEIKDKYKILNNDFVVIFTGRLVKEKGPHHLLRAYEYMSYKNKCKILLLGSRLYGENTSDRYTNELQSIAQRNQNNIIFTGFVNYDEIANYYKLADVGCSPALWEEPCSLTIIEYLTFGLPVITTNSGGSPELVDSCCSFVFERSEDLPKQIAKALDYLIANPEVKKAMSIAAADRGKLFTKEKYVEMFNGELLI